jgi:hypothetical protein
MLDLIQILMRYQDLDIYSRADIVERAMDLLLLFIQKIG